MPTGACGINCDVCRLRLIGLGHLATQGGTREAIDAVCGRKGGASRKSVSGIPARQRPFTPSRSHVHSHEMHSLGQVAIASSMQVSSPPCSWITRAFSPSSSRANTSGQSSAQLPQPMQHSSSSTTLRAMIGLLDLQAFPGSPLNGRGDGDQQAQVGPGPQAMGFADIGHEHVPSACWDG